MIAEVIVDITHSEVDKIFEYSFTDSEIKCGSRVIVPFGKKFIEGIVIKIKETSNFPIDKIKPIFSILEEIPALNTETLKMAENIKRYSYVTMAAALRLFLPSEMRNGRIKEKFVRFISLKGEIDVQSEINLLRKSAIKQRELLLYLKENGKVKYTLACEKFGTSAVKALIDKALLIETEEKDFRSPYSDLSITKKDITLTDSQKEAVNSIENTDKRVSLIFGVTGSGKTEVYLHLIDNVIKSKKNAIMLVPEIALTPQMLKQLRARFGDYAAILHSGLSAGERFDEWWRLRTGEAKIAIGARSAIFAPLENVGLIIIDEEHDGSYSSESSPRYSTLEVAKYRAELSNAKLVLGSATPSVESFLNAQNGVYNLVELPERINKKPLPKVEIADMKGEIRRGNNTPFSGVLKAELQECLEKGNQAIIFLNQRGYSKSVICTECGHVQKCKSCDVSLTYHKEDDSLLCHYCGAKYKMITACTECGSRFIRYGGFGTERVVIELKKLFPSARILRMDRDTTQNKEGHFKILNDFSDRKADILVGTQMIAKGHDFPFVTLVGILDADMSLHFSDFRSAERTYQLLTQVSGRSGRDKEAGKVVLQTYSPDNPVLIQAINYDYEGFFKHEISLRKATGFPPFYDIIRILISVASEEKTLEITKVLYQELLIFYNENKDKFRFFGCMKAPIKRLQNKFRYQILMRIKTDDQKLKDLIYSYMAKYQNRSVSLYMEINPNNLS